MIGFAQYVSPETNGALLVGRLGSAFADIPIAITASHMLVKMVLTAFAFDRLWQAIDRFWQAITQIALCAVACLERVKNRPRPSFHLIAAFPSYLSLFLHTLHSCSQSLPSLSASTSNICSRSCKVSKIHLARNVGNVPYTQE
jgi:hypothetical protein